MRTRTLTSSNRGKTLITDTALIQAATVVVREFVGDIGAKTELRPHNDVVPPSIIVTLDTTKLRPTYSAGAAELRAHIKHTLTTILGIEVLVDVFTRDL
ncbi:hypothetical protein [Microbacterium arborescens]|uniref:hypothetical protein n=1 Tax=Microbacterium arborescens TaxID=33883 RepID=UPI002786FD32|nr:hypothetical protein [Microbacterium arborescens]MDQ1218023.1 flagellar basal body-associated protein FliL [Microbacterium arborescens]